MQKVSAVVITYNEAKKIKDCLKSLLWTDEIIVVDSYSTDKTVEICKRFGAKVYKKKWEGYSRQKNFGIKKAKNDWVLSLDADERVSTELKNEIKSLQLSENTPVGFKIPRKNLYFGKWLKYGGNYPDYQLRLFNKNYGRFVILPVHEYIRVTGKIGTLKSPIVHYTYRDIQEYFEKFKIYTMLGAELLAKKKVRICFLNSVKFLVFKPIKRLLTRLFIKKAYLDGKEGLIALFLDILTMIVTYLIYWQRNK